MVFSKILKSWIHNATWNTKADKILPQVINSKDINFKIRSIDKKETIIPGIIGFLVSKKRKYIIQSMCQKMLCRKTCWVINGRKRRENTRLIIDFNRFMYDHSLHREKKNFCCYFYMLLLHKKFQSIMLKIALKLIVNKQIRWLRKVNMLILKIVKKKYNHQSWFIMILKLF